LEKAGIPCVLETWDFPDIIGITEDTFLLNGVPEIRQVLTPPDTTLTSLREYIPEFIDALTRPLTDEEKWSGTYEPPGQPRILMTGTYDEVQSYFEGDLTRFPVGVAPVALMTDGQPVVPPTEDRVARMLTGTSHSPDEIIEIKHQRSGQVQYLATVEKVAINAVMAGCKPEYMPVALAMSESNLPVGGPTDCTSGQMYVVSGPIAKEIGMNAFFEVLGPGNPANSTLGRAAALMGVNLGGCQMGVSTIGRHGDNIWGLTFAEATDRSPWEGLNVDCGFGADESVLVNFGGAIGIMPPCSASFQIPLDLKEFQASMPEGIEASLEGKIGSIGLVFFTPDTAELWKEEYGFETMQELQDYLFDNCEITAGDMRKHYSFVHLKQRILANPPGSRTLNPDHLELPDDALVPVFCEGPDAAKIIVTGGDGMQWGWGRSSSVKSTLIDKWR